MIEMIFQEAEANMERTRAGKLARATQHVHSMQAQYDANDPAGSLARLQLSSNDESLNDSTQSDAIARILCCNR